MVKWSYPGSLDPGPLQTLTWCWRRTRVSRVKVWFLMAVLVLNIFTGIVAQVNSHNHVTTHTVNTKYGALRGVRLQFSSSATKHLDPVSAYLGIPYASPPINAYRFMPPVAPLPWGPGTRLAVTLPPACPQRFPEISNRTKALQTMTMQRYLFLQKLVPHLANQSEDCLYLNFYVPTVPPGDEVRPGKFAILFIIHGESWEWGSGNEFDGGILASLGNHIVVTFNYRLGILGFLKTDPKKVPGGLLDVIAAVHWVRENCDSFGGDRNRITLLGYRTGAVIANLLLIAQIAKDLFQRAILISGSVLSPWALQRRPEEVALQVSIHLSCKGVLPLSHPESDLAPCLRRKHLSELLSFVPDTPRFLSPFAPYVDNILLRSPKLMMEGSEFSRNEQFQNSQLLVVFTTSEGVHELNDAECKHGFESEHRDRILRTLVRNVFNYHQQEIFSIVRNEYTDWERPILHPIPLRDATVEALSDCLVIAPAIQLALTHAKLIGAKNTYLLHFSHVSRDVDFTPYERLGSMEGDVVPYTMGLPVTNNVPALGGQPFISPWSSLSNFSKQDAVVSETLIHYLTNFVRTGDPNSNEVFSPSSGGAANDWAGSSSRERARVRSLHWEPFEPNTQLYMNLGVKPRLKNHYRGHKLALWLNLIPQIHLPGGSEVSPNHHTFQDDSPSHYVGPVRQLYPLSFGDQIPGIGTSLIQSPAQTSTVSSGIPVTPTECVESTESSYSQGTRYNGILQSLDLDEEGSVRINVNGLGSREEVSPGAEGSGGDYDYTTALTVTLTVGVCLILLNLLVFSAIMCHRKRGLSGALSLSTSDSPGSRHGLSGTPLKASYQDEFKWTSCSSSHGIMSPGDPFSAHLSDSIPMSQYPGDYCPASASLMRRSSGYNPREERDESDARSPSPPMPHHHHPHHYALQPSKADYNCRTFGPHSYKQQPPSSSAQQQHRVQVQIPMSNCLLGHEGCSETEETSFNGEGLGAPGSGSIRLYMNQSAGDAEHQFMPDIGTSTLPRSNCPTYSNTNSLRRISKPTNSPCNAQMSPPSSNSGNTSVSNTGGNPSPSTGNTTLVSALKRHTSSGTPNSTVKKRVQIQEISV